MMAIHEMTAARMQQLWAVGQTDDLWQIKPHTFQAFDRAVQEFEAAEFFLQGGMKCLTLDLQACGFVIFNVVPQHLTDGSRVVECGTYIMPQFRGQGLHATVKRLTIQYAIEALDAEFTIFIIPETNERAIRALKKLPWNFQSSSVNQMGRFDKLRKRKAWESGVNVVVYDLHSTEFLDA